MEIRIGSRGSALALAQTRMVAESLVAARPGLVCEIIRITTTGDIRRTESLPDIGGKGLFTRELEEALLAGRIDLAVHSLKDLPTELPDGLTLGAVPERAPANDALISATGARLAELRQGAVVGTSSPRRAAQLRRLRPDLRTTPIRGNLDTRIRKLREGEGDAIVVALAGLVRLGAADRATEILPFDVMLPAPGQGALALEIRADNAPVSELLASVTHPPTVAATTAERALLHALGGGCTLPLGAHAEAAGETLRLRALLLTPDGKNACHADCTGKAADPVGLARAAADDLRRAGADAVLRSLART